MEKIIKINCDAENYRQIWVKEWDALIKLTGLKDLPHGKDSFRENFPAIHKYLIDGLNQIREQAREEENKLQEITQEEWNQYLTELGVHPDYWCDYNPEDYGFKLKE